MRQQQRKAMDPSHKQCQAAFAKPPVDQIHNKIVVLVVDDDQLVRIMVRSGRRGLCYCETVLSGRIGDYPSASPIFRTPAREDSASRGVRRAAVIIGGGSW